MSAKRFFFDQALAKKSILTYERYVASHCSTGTSVRWYSVHRTTGISGQDLRLADEAIVTLLEL